MYVFHLFHRDAKEDTSVDHNPLYREVHEAQFFGRGNIAGIDVSQQKKEKGQFYEQVVEDRRSQAEKEREEQRQVKMAEKEQKKVRAGDRGQWGEEEAGRREKKREGRDGGRKRREIRRREIRSEKSGGKREKRRKEKGEKKREKRRKEKRENAPYSLHPVFSSSLSFSYLKPVSFSNHFFLTHSLPHSASPLSCTMTATGRKSRWRP